nr:DUF763 domain-containing protein [Pseudomonadota bacterium]
EVSRLVAKVDSAAVQDGFQLYLHGFIVTDDGHWAVIQQGMNDRRKQARRYHWLSEGLEDFVDQPHAAIEGEARGAIINLTDRKAQSSRQAQLEILASLGPDGITRELTKLEREMPGSQGRPLGRSLKGPSDPMALAAAPARPVQTLLPHLAMPKHHELRAGDVIMRRLHGNFAAAADRGPKDFKELLLVPGVGARTVRALAMVAEVVHGAPCRFTDPARFSLAHGGKDGHPFPVPTRVYDQTINVMKSAIQKARLGREEALDAIRRLDQEARRLERHASGPSLQQVIAQERAQSPSFGGRSVFGWEQWPGSQPDSQSEQGDLGFPLRAKGQ